MLLCIDLHKGYGKQTNKKYNHFRNSEVGELVFYDDLAVIVVIVN